MNIDRASFLMVAFAVLCCGVSNIINTLSIQEAERELRALRLAVQQYEGTVPDAR